MTSERTIAPCRFDVSDEAGALTADNEKCLFVAGRDSLVELGERWCRVDLDFVYSRLPPRNELGAQEPQVRPVSECPRVGVHCIDELRLDPVFGLVGDQGLLPPFSDG